VKNYGTNLDEIKNQLHCEFRQNQFNANFVEELINMKAVAIQKHNESSKSGSSTGTKESENANECSDIETLRTGFSEESVKKIIDSDCPPIEKE
jgi:hypothetical protein